ncbi:MAG: hypothetical protein AB8H79_05115 [Myxococcota bacterium]
MRALTISLVLAFVLACARTGPSHPLPLTELPASDEFFGIQYYPKPMFLHQKSGAFTEFKSELVFAIAGKGSGPSGATPVNS